MASSFDRALDPTTIRYVAIVVMFAGLAIVAYEEATTDASIIGLFVIAAGLLLSGVSHLAAARAED